MKIHYSPAISRLLLMGLVSGWSAMAMDPGHGGGGGAHPTSFTHEAAHVDEVDVIPEGHAPTDHPGWAEWAAQYGAASADRVYGADDDQAIAEAIAIMALPHAGGGVGGGGGGGGVGVDGGRARPVRSEEEEEELALHQANQMAQREADGRPPLARRLF